MEGEVDGSAVPFRPLIWGGFDDGRTDGRQAAADRRMAGCAGYTIDLRVPPLLPALPHGRIRVRHCLAGAQQSFNLKNDSSSGSAES